MEDKLRNESASAQEKIERLKRENAHEQENHLYRQQLLEKELASVKADLEGLQREHENLQDNYSRQRSELRELKQQAEELDKEKRVLRAEFEM